MKYAVLVLVFGLVVTASPVFPGCVMTADFIAGNSEENMSKIYSCFREKDYDTITQMVLSGQAMVLKKGAKIYRAKGGFFSSTVTVGASPTQWIVANDRFTCTLPGASSNQAKAAADTPEPVSLQDQLSEACRNRQAGRFVDLVREGADPFKPDSSGAMPITLVQDKKTRDALARIAGMLKVETR